MSLQIEINGQRFRPVGALNVIYLVKLLTLCFFHCVELGSEQFIQPGSHECACTDSVQMFNCTTVGLGTTLWTGTAFNCPTSSNRIALENIEFATGSFGSCNSEKIAARGVEVINGDCYTSQLNVTISPGLNQTSIECKYNSDLGITAIGQAILTVLQSDYPSPGNVTVASASPEGLIFTWNAIAPLCSSIQYRINASKCGNCPTESMTAQAACTDLQPSTEKRTCRFSVQNVVCGTVGNQSSPLLASIGVPGTPQVMITPYYFNDTQDLRILIRNCSSEMNYTDIDQVRACDVHINFSSGSSVNYSNVTNGIDVSSFCSSTTFLSIVVSALNVFGKGPPSSPIIIGCTNQFVKLEYNPSASTLSCQFLTQPDTSKISCSVSYRKCHEEQSEAQKFSMANVTVNPIKLRLSVSEGNLYCFVVNASNNTFSVMVEGNITIPVKGIMPNIAAITVPALVALIIAMIVVTVVIIMVIFRKILLSKSDTVLLIEPETEGESVEECKDEDMRPITTHKQFYITSNPFAKDSKNLRQFCNKHKFRANAVFMKYNKLTIKKNDVQDVIVLKMKDKDIPNGVLYTGPSARDTVLKPDEHELADRISFVLVKDSMDIANYELGKETMVLHQNPQWKTAKFHVLMIEKDDVEMNTFVKEKLNLGELKKGSVFYEFKDNQPEDLQYYKEVLHVSEDELKLDNVVELTSYIEHFYDIVQDKARPRKTKDHVFIQSISLGPKPLKAGSWLLYKKES